MSSITCTCIRILEAACMSTVSTARSCGLEAVCIRELLNNIIIWKAQPPVFHTRARSSETSVPYWYAMGAYICRSRDLKSI